MFHVIFFLLQDNYDVAFVKQIYGAPSVTVSQLQRGGIDHSEPVRITYENKDVFKKTAKALGLMDDFKVILCYQYSLFVFRVCRFNFTSQVQDFVI